MPQTPPAPPQPKHDLDEWSRALHDILVRAREHRVNETELREDADKVIIAAADDLYGLSDLGATAERSPGPRHFTRKHYDKLYWGVVVEWEWRLSSDAEHDHAATQALDYLAMVRASARQDEAFTSVVANGEEWGFLATTDDEAEDLFALYPGAHTPPVRKRLEWRANSPAACRRFLELIGSHRQQSVTPRGLATSFGPSSQSAKTIITLLSESFAGRTSGDRPDTLYREWRRSLDVVYGNLDGKQGRLSLTIRSLFGLAITPSLGELLFVVHTYFSLVARLVAIEILGLSVRERDSQPTTWGSLSDDELMNRLLAIDSGTIPRSLTVNNLFEADVFSWYHGSLQGNIDLLNALRDLLRTLESFAFPRVAYGANPATDILRDLYQALVPRVLRKALGEFLTPPWLAEACIARLRRLGAGVDKRVLDPTCGTGTFLVPILRDRVRRLRADHAETATAADIQELLNDVVGIDINPIAVTAARVNYVTVLGELLSRGTVTLPVWRADSIIIPDASPIQGDLSDGRLTHRPWQRLSTSLSEPFPVPPALATAERMAVLRTLLEAAMEEKDASRSEEGFASGLEAEYGPGGRHDLGASGNDWDDVREVALELHDRIRKLRDKERNGVWARIIENSFAPVFAGRFDVVLGNPPWLTWTKMPTEWREATRLVWMRYGLWRVPASGGRGPRSLASTDLATLVFAVALDRYAKPGGTVGLLMPRAIVSADPGNRAFRQFRLRPDPRDGGPLGDIVDIPFGPAHLDDWSNVKPFAPDAANSPVFLAAVVGKNPAAPFPTVRWERALARTALDGQWNKVEPLLRAVAGQSAPVDPAEPTSAWSFQPVANPDLIEGGSNQWDFGKGLDTRGANGVYFVQVLRATSADRVLIENDPSQGRLQSVKVCRGEVESLLVYPLLRGRDVRPWLAVPSGYIIAPHDPADLGDVLTDHDLQTLYPEARAWFRRFAAILAGRRTPPTRSWDMAGKDWCRLDGPLQYMAGQHIVVIREQDARPAAAVVQRSYNPVLGRTAPVLVDHKLVFCAVETADEAHYLAAMLNCTAVQDLLASYANTIAISHQTLARLPIPAWDAQDPDRTAVAESGKAAHAAAAAGWLGPQQQREVDEKAAIVLSLGSAYRPQARQGRKRVRRIPGELLPADQGVLFR